MTNRLSALFLLSTALACAEEPAPAPHAAASALAPAASTGAEPRVTGFQPGPSGVTLRTTIGDVAITAVNDHVVRVRVGTERALARDFSWAVVPGASAPTGKVTVADEGAAI